MPIVGNLSEFPLPEVLLLIGARTGRLRLLDVPEYGVMEIDFSNGEMQGLHLGPQWFERDVDILGKLSAVVQRNDGMFEFCLQPVSSVSRNKPLMINQLVMSLVCQVDEDCARDTAQFSTELYGLEEPEPEIWVEQELYAFFLSARQLFQRRTNMNEISEYLTLPPKEVRTHLTNLRLLGFIKQIEMELELPQMDLEKRSNDFALGLRATAEIQKLTGRLPKVRQKAS